MSHFTTLKVEFKDLKSLVQALRDLGFEPEVHEQPQHLYGYEGDRRNQTAEIIVRRSQIYCESNDLGFKWNGKAYEAIISEYDRGWGGCAPGRGLGRQFLRTTEDGKIAGKLMAAYAKNVVYQQAQRMGMQVVSTGKRNGANCYQLVGAKRR